MSKEVEKCKIKECKRPYRAKGYCNVHYKKWRQGEYGKIRYKTCKNEGCRKPLSRFGMCAEHYEAWMKSKKGTVTAAPAVEVAPAVEAAPAS